VKSILVAQSITMVVVALVVFLFHPLSARDAFIGGAAAVIGSVFFAFWTFGRYRANEPGRLLARFYGGEVMKIVVILAIFGAAMNWLENLNPIALFGAFFVVQILPPLLANKIAN